MTKNRYILILTLLLVLLLMNLGCTYQEKVNTTTNIPPPPPEPTVVEVAAVGDFLMHMPVINAAWQADLDNYNFLCQLEPVRDLLAKPDLTIANLETRLAGRQNGGYSGYPVFNCPEQLAFDMKEGGIDVVLTANNHSLDRGYTGLVQTLDHLDTAALATLGNYRTAEERQQPMVLDIKGVKIGLLNYTESTNGIPLPQGKEYAVNMIDMEQITAEIAKLRQADAEVIIACIHFGVEYQRHPNQQQQQLVDELFNLGIDIILGNHVHVIQPMEKRTIDYQGQQKDVFVIYSLGNFISNQRWQYSDSGVIVNVVLEKDWVKNTVKIKKIDYVPTWVHVYQSNGKQKYRVVAVEKALHDYENNVDSTITTSDYQRLREVWQETTTHLSREEQQIYHRPVR
jgi:poly-gamma-glutamate synthesis protein (capsule biosynthesis protein)